MATSCNNTLCTVRESVGIPTCKEILQDDIPERTLITFNLFTRQKGQIFLQQIERRKDENKMRTVGT